VGRGVSYVVRHREEIVDVDERQQRPNLAFVGVDRRVEPSVAPQRQGFHVDAENWAVYGRFYTPTVQKPPPSGALAGALTTSGLRADTPDRDDKKGNGGGRGPLLVGGAESEGATEAFQG
jgi:hypothetical protein